jgi:putative transposase
MKPRPNPHYCHRFPAELHQPRGLAVPRVQFEPARRYLLLAERGIVVSYDSIRRWCRKFGQHFAYILRRRRPKPGDKWHLDAVFVRIQGEPHYLWRAVDQNGVVLDILVQARRDAKAAKRFFKRLLQGLQYVPRVIVADTLRSYGAAKRKVRFQRASNSPATNWFSGSAASYCRKARSAAYRAASRSRVMASRAVAAATTIAALARLR